MKQIIQKTELGTAVDLSIDTADIFSEDFKQYAKLVYLAICHARTDPNRTLTVNVDDLEVTGRVNDAEDPRREIITSLIHSTIDAVELLMHDLTEELSDPEKLNDALAELFGDAWDRECRRFKEDV